MDKPRRTTKKVNYAALDAANGEDDDDFVATPPLKKIKTAEPIKNKRQKANKENITKSSGIPRNQTINSPTRRSPVKRIPLEEKKFEKELQMALQLSQASTVLLSDNEVSSPEISARELENEAFDGFYYNKAGNKQLNVLEDEEKVSKSDSDVQGESYKNEVKVSCLPNIDPHLKRKNEDPEPIPSTSTGFTAKRQRKKINFKEDEESDEYSAEQDSLESSESEWSDFCESPKKTKKNSKEKPPPTKKTTKEKQTKKKSPVISKTSIASKSKPQPISIKTKQVPVSAKSNPSTPTSLKNTTKPSSSNISGPSKPISETISTPGACRVGLLASKASFKSPGSKNSNSTLSNQSPGIGLRLGLSKRGNFKPLHPKASVK